MKSYECCASLRLSFLDKGVLGIGGLNCTMLLLYETWRLILRRYKWLCMLSLRLFWYQQTRISLLWFWLWNTRDREIASVSMIPIVSSVYPTWILLTPLICKETSNLVERALPLHLIKWYWRFNSPSLVASLSFIICGLAIWWCAAICTH